MEIEYMDFLSFTPSTIVGTLLNALILFWVIKHFLFDKVNAVLKQRNDEVAKTYEDAGTALDNAKSMETQYMEKLSSAKP